jgi:hypothetical protein
VILAAPARSAIEHIISRLLKMKAVKRANRLISEERYICLREWHGLIMVDVCGYHRFRVQLREIDASKLPSGGWG